MIKIRSLQVHNFKQLKDIRLKFPDKGSVLVEGRNEAGKSTFFEAIFFGLFGEALVTEENRNNLNDLVEYNATMAVVQLDLELRDRLFRITRTIKRDKPNAWRLVILSPDGKEELINKNTAVNQRIIRELGLDADALLNSCFVEQKKLEKLEGLSATDRRRSLLRILNLEFLDELQSQLHLRKEDDYKLSELRDRAQLAKILEEIPDREFRKAELDQAILFYELKQILLLIEERRKRIKGLEEYIQSLLPQQEELEERLHKIDLFEKGKQASEQIISGMMRIQDLEKQIQETQKQLKELDTLEVILPQKASRLKSIGILVRQINRMDSLLNFMTEMKRQAEAIQTQLDDMERLKNTVRELQRKQVSLQEEIEITRKKENELLFLNSQFSRLQKLREKCVEWNRELEKTCGELDEFNRFQRSLKNLSEQVSEIDGKIHLGKIILRQLESLASRSRHLDDLVQKSRDLENRFETLKDQINHAQKIQNQLTETDLRLQNLHQKKKELEGEVQSLARKVRMADERDALEGWHEAETARNGLAEIGNKEKTLQTKITENQSSLSILSGKIDYFKKKQAVSFAGGGIFTILAVVGFLVGLPIIGILGILAALGLTSFAIVQKGPIQKIHTEQVSLEKSKQDSEQEQLRLEGRRQSLESKGVDYAARLEEFIGKLQSLSAEVPGSLKECEEKLNAIHPELKGFDASAARTKLSTINQDLARNIAVITETEKQRETLEKDNINYSLDTLLSEQKSFALKLQRYQQIDARWSDRLTQSATDILQDSWGEDELRTEFIQKQLVTCKENLAALTARRESLEGNESQISNQIEGYDLPLLTSKKEMTQSQVEKTLKIQERRRESLDNYMDQIHIKHPPFEEEAVTIQSWLSSMREKLSAQQATLDGLCSQLNTAEHQLCSYDEAVLNRKKISLETRLQKGEIIRTKGLLQIQNRAKQCELSPEILIVQEAYTLLANELERNQSDLNSRSDLHDKIMIHQESVEEIHLANSEIYPAISKADNRAPSWDRDIPLQKYNQIRDYYEKQIQTLNEEETQSSLREILGKSHTAQGEIEIRRHEIQKSRLEVAGYCQSLHLNPPAGEPGLEEMESAYSQIKEVPCEDTQLRSERDSVNGELIHLTAQVKDLSEKLHLESKSLEAMDSKACQNELEEFEHDMRVRSKAEEIVKQARERLVTKVLPSTIEHMRQILPALTMDRYHDAEITEDYRIKVWDERAEGWKSKNIFSGGTRDQFSLALRLAFALATLPQERGAAPGFIFLDEPLSSFDQERSLALMELITTGDIAEAFDQIFVISHSQVLDPGMFHHHLVLDDGIIISSTLDPLEEQEGSDSLLIQ